MKTKRWWLEKILLFFFFFFFHAKQKLETEVLPSRIERSRSSAKQKLGQDLPQREGESGTGRKAARNRPNSSHSRFPPLPAFPPFVAARNDDEQCANAEGFPRKRLFALSEGKYEYHRFVRTLTLLPREPFRFTCPPPPSFLASFPAWASERDLSELGTINVCLKFPGSTAAMINASHSAARPSASMKNNLFRLRARILRYAPRNFHPPWNSS